MLYLLFQLGRDRYALPASRVMEVLPLVELQRIQNVPKGMAGIFNYRGQPVPVMDLGELTSGQQCRPDFSTRIIVIQYPDESGKLHPLGLIAERATEMMQRDIGEFKEPGLKLGAPAYLGPVLLDNRGVIQLIREQRLLPEETRDRLFGQLAETCK